MRKLGLIAGGRDVFAELRERGNAPGRVVTPAAVIVPQAAAPSPSVPAKPIRSAASLPVVSTPKVLAKNSNAPRFPSSLSLRKLIKWGIKQII